MNRFLATVLLLFMAGAVTARQGEPPPRQRRARALEGFAQSSGDEALRQFAETQLAPAYRDTFKPADLTALLQSIRKAAGSPGGVLYRPVGSDGLRVTFLGEEGESSVLFRIEPEPPHRIVLLELEGTRPREPRAPEGPPITWVNLEASLAEEETKGFSGTVLVAHDGKIVLHRGYGLADRENKLPNTTDTIFAIGSTPIDFTRAAILKLEEMGRLRTADAITRYLKDVPADKRAMTLDHLMRGASGLPNFHHVLGVDKDPDLSWIDRDTAVQRILGQTLLFMPGQGQAHSHSAWVLLAAIVEIASGEPYGDFLRHHFFGPAGMTRTGLHEEAAAIADDQFAVGYEGKPVGSPNTPKSWGRTSWLVMGSGGMQSTTMDLYRWMQAIRAGRTLSAASASRYWSHGVLAGGDERGFFTLYNEGPDDLVILCSNAQGAQVGRAQALGRRLVGLVMPSRQSPDPAK